MNELDIINIIKKNKMDVNNYTRKERKLVVKYFKHYNFEALFEIGWKYEMLSLPCHLLDLQHYYIYKYNNLNFISLFYLAIISYDCYKGQFTSAIITFGLYLIIVYVNLRLKINND